MALDRDVYKEIRGFIEPRGIRLRVFARFLWDQFNCQDRDAMAEAYERYARRREKTQPESAMS